MGLESGNYGKPDLRDGRHFQRAMTMKSLGDATALPNRLIEHLEEADTECAAKDRKSLLSFVVVGGGFAGVETVGSINDFLKDAVFVEHSFLVL